MIIIFRERHLIIKIKISKQGTMQPSNEKSKLKAERQAESQLSMIDTRGTQHKDIDKYEKVESIRDFFRPDFTVYVQQHASTTKNGNADITDQTLKQASIETQGCVQNKFGEQSLASLMPLDPMFMTYSVPTQLADPIIERPSEI